MLPVLFFMQKKGMMKMILLIIIFLSLLILFLYSACVISSRCSRLEELEEQINDK